MPTIDFGWLFESTIGHLPEVNAVRERIREELLKATGNDLFMTIDLKGGRLVHVAARRIGDSWEVWTGQLSLSG